MNRLLLLIAISLLPHTALAQNYRIDTVIGLGNKVGDGDIALEALLRSPAGIALDLQGRLIIADKQHHRIRRVASDGRITTIAGTGLRGVRGDDGPAVEAELWEPSGIAINSKGTILVADGSSRIRAITPDGRINTLAGNGRNGFSGDGGKATEASIGIPGGIAVDTADNFYFSEVLQARVRRVSADGIITTFAGNGTGRFSGDGGPAVDASLLIPLGLAMSPTNTLFIADFGNLRIREVLANGTIRTLAGGGQGGDGGDAIAAFLGNPCAVAVDASRNVYIGESGSRVRRVDASGKITTVASAENAQSGQPVPVPFSPDAGPCGLAPDRSAGLYVSQGGNDAVSRIQLDKTPWTAQAVAGRLSQALASLPPRKLALFLPQGLEIAADQSILFTDAEAQRIFRSNQGSLSVFAGIGRPGFSGDSGPAVNAAFTAPIAIAGGTSGRYWIADSLNRRIRLVSPNGQISTVASGDASNPVNRLGIPLELVAGLDGNLYFTELGKHTVRRMDSSGNMTTVAGGEQTGFAGDGGDSTSSLLNNPIGLAIDPAGNLYIADAGNQAVRRINPSGRIDTIAGRGQVADWVPMPATRAILSNPNRLSIDATGALLIAETTSDGKAGSIRRLDSTGQLIPIAGNRLGGEAGEAALAQRASIGPIGGLRGAPDCSVWLTDSANRTIRRLTPLTPASIRIAGGDSQSGLVGAALPEPLAASVLDESGIPLPGISLRFRVISGSARVEQDLVQTDWNGIALAVLKAGAEAGPIEVEAKLVDSAILVEPIRFQLQSVASIAAPTSSAPQFRITTTAGTARTANQESVFLADPVGFATDRNGNYYLSDAGLNRILKVAPDGTCQVVAGLSESGFCRQAQSTPQAILGPAGLLVSPDGDLFFVERLGNRVRRLSSSGELTLFAGSGLPGFAGDKGPASAARLNSPQALALAPDGSILISDTGNRRLRKVDSSGIIETFAGSGSVGSGGAGAPALQAPFVAPMGMSFGTDGVLYIADAGAHQVKGISTEGIVFIVAGTGKPPVLAQRQTGVLPDELDTPLSVAISSSGAIYISEFGRVRVLAPGVAPASIPDRGFGQRLLLTLSDDKLYILDSDRAALRLLEPDSTLRSLLGSRFYGDGGQAIDATLSSAEGLAFDSEGNLYVSDTQNNRVRRILLSGAIETIAGNGLPVSAGDGGPANQASIDGPAGLVVQPDGSLLVAESRGARIRRISPDGIISTFAGSGLLGNTGDNGFAREASFQSPTGLALDSSGNLFVSDYLANTIRKISPDGIIRSYGGSGRTNIESTNPVIGLRATETDFQGPSGLALDAAGNLLVVDKLNNRIWKLLPSGAISVLAGNGQRRASGESVVAVDSSFNRPSSIAVDRRGRIFVSEEANRIRVIQPDGLVFTIAGRGPSGLSGDDGPASQATLSDPGALAIAPDGAIVFSDRGNRRLRRLLEP